MHMCNAHQEVMCMRKTQIFHLKRKIAHHSMHQNKAWSGHKTIHKTKQDTKCKLATQEKEQSMQTKNAK